MAILTEVMVVMDMVMATATDMVTDMDIILKKKQKILL